MFDGLFFNLKPANGGHLTHHPSWYHISTATVELSNLEPQSQTQTLKLFDRHKYVSPFALHVEDYCFLLTLMINCATILYCFGWSTILFARMWVPLVRVLWHNQWVLPRILLSTFLTLYLTRCLLVALDTYFFVWFSVCSIPVTFLWKALLHLVPNQ